MWGIAEKCCKTLQSISAAVGVCKDYGNIKQLLKTSNTHISQVRTKYPNWKMVKDIKKRKIFQENGPERLRINSVRKSDFLPRELKEIADREIKELPLNSAYTRIHNRCMITSRPRAVQKRWRCSRIVVRSLADYNELSGMTRSCW